MLGSACPSLAATTWTGSPASNKVVAWMCRRSCSRIRGSGSSLCVSSYWSISFGSSCEGVSRNTGAPNAVRKTRSESCQSDSTTSRSAAWRALWAFSSRTVSGSMLTLRRPRAPVTGHTTRHVPAEPLTRCQAVCAEPPSASRGSKIFSAATSPVADRSTRARTPGAENILPLIPGPPRRLGYVRHLSGEGEEWRALPCRSEQLDLAPGHAATP